jgi:hypothetical protein
MTFSYEVISMLTEEWNIERAKVVWQREAREDEKLENAERLLKRGVKEEVVADGLDLPLSKVLEIKEKISC